MAHQIDAHNEGSGQWLPLTEYSVRSGVSLSTIRRKIKSNSIPYRLENGRYLILFEGENRKEKMQDSSASISSPRKPVYQNPETLPIVERSVNMVSEAFEYAIQEKDARIQLLEKQNTDLAKRLDELRLLVQVLEDKYDVRY